jgi:hypothetical protein
MGVTGIVSPKHVDRRTTAPVVKVGGNYAFAPCFAMERQHV